MEKFFLVDGKRLPRRAWRDKRSTKGPTKHSPLSQRSGRRAPWHSGCFWNPGKQQPPSAGVTMSKLVRMLLAAGALVGCAHSTTPPPPFAQVEYRIGKEDVVAVEVWKEPALSAKVPVRPDGKVSLPMVG